jgi:hypothetical protein
MRCSAHSTIRTIGYSDYKSFIWILTESHSCSARAFTKVVKTPRKFEPWFEFGLDQPRQCANRDCTSRTMFRLRIEESQHAVASIFFATRISPTWYEPLSRESRSLWRDLTAKSSCREASTRRTIRKTTRRRHHTNPIRRSKEYNSGRNSYGSRCYRSTIHGRSAGIRE